VRRDREIIVLSKADLLTPEEASDKLEAMPEGTIMLSSATGEGVRRFLEILAQVVSEMKRSQLSSSSAPTEESEEPL
jgi:50S ribosomal subunit-associated GTPase HflX